MTNRRYYLPIMATVIGLVLAGWSYARFWVTA